MDIFAVISKMDSQDKLGTSHPDMRPKVSILDPTYTFTVPKNQTAAGTADIFSHICEGYFTVEQDAFVSDRFCEGLMKTCIHYAPVALSQPDNYEARANLMWASSNAINGMTELGKPRAWSVHPIEHQLSAVYDITHGVGLAILTPNWMTYVLNETTLPRFVTYGVNVWGMDPALPPWRSPRAPLPEPGNSSTPWASPPPWASWALTGPTSTRWPSRPAPTPLTTPLCPCQWKTLRRSTA